jgi:integrase/recombinase XerD
VKRGAHVPFPVLIERYIAERLRTRRFAQVTADHTRERLVSFSKRVSGDPNKVTRDNVIRYVTESSIAAGTARRRLMDLRGLFSWAEAEGYLATDPTGGVLLPRGYRSVPRRLKSDESKLVATAIDEQWFDERLTLMLAFAYGEALRNVEIARMRVEDLDRPGRKVGVRGKFGDGALTRTVPLSERTCRALDAYLAAEPDLLNIELRPGTYLFRNHTYPNKGMRPERIGVLVKLVLYELGIKKEILDGVSSHALRHTAAAEAIEAGARIEQVQRLLGHYSPLTTGMYLQGAVIDLEDIHELRSEARRVADGEQQSIADEVRKLADLRASLVLTADEFAMLKKRLLGRGYQKRP